MALMSLAQEKMICSYPSHLKNGETNNKDLKVMQQKYTTTLPYSWNVGCGSTNKKYS